MPPDDLLSISPDGSAVTEHGEDGEGLLELNGELLDAEQEQAEDGDGRDHAEVVVGGAEAEERSTVVLAAPVNAESTKVVLPLGYCPFAQLVPS